MRHPLLTCSFNPSLIQPVTGGRPGRAHPCLPKDLTITMTLPTEFSRFLNAPTLEVLCDLSVQVGTPISIGQTAQGLRRIIPLLGGQVTGQIVGTLLPGGADYQLLLDGARLGHLDARYVIETEARETIFVQNKALRVMSSENSQKMMRGEAVNPEVIYFRSQVQFETESNAYRWLQDFQFIGTGVRLPTSVHLRFFKVL